MNETDDVYLALLLQFMLLSLMAVGGANVLLPEMHRFAVEGRGWMSSKEFSELFALAQAAPGPNVLFVSVIGWKAAGLILTSGILLVRSAGQSAHALVVSSAVVLISLRYNPNPLWFIAGGALVGLLFF